MRGGSSNLRESRDDEDAARSVCGGRWSGVPQWVVTERVDDT
jgi:hypothetical protein